MGQVTIRENVTDSCRQNGLPDDFIAYFLSMIELAGGNPDTPAANESKFIATMERNLKELGHPEAICAVATLQNDPRTG